MIYQNYKHLITLLCLCFVLVAHSQEEISDILFELESHQDLKNGICGFSLIDLDSREEIASLNGQTSLIPASSLKILTSFAALDILGNDFRYVTRISYDGQILDDGTLTGNIYIEGSGDPSLGSKRNKTSMDFNQLLAYVVNEIKKFGITCIDGDIVADESIFDSFPICPSWQWNDLGNYYACGAWGLNVNENLYNLYFTNREKVGTVPMIRTHYPFIPRISFSNEVITDKPGTPDNAYIFGGPYEYYKRIIGSIPSGKGDYIIKGSIPDPPLFLAYHIQKSLLDEGVSSNGYKTQFHKINSGQKRLKIAEIQSPILLELVKKANYHSINLYSEAFLKTIGQKLAQDGSGTTGIAELESYLKKKQLNINSLYMEDGSGLSARNLISAGLLSRFLAYFANNYDKEMIFSLLPQAGKDGTMRFMFRKSPAQKRIWAKSGSMERVQSFTGFIQGKSGKFYSFSILCNNFTIKNREMRDIIEKYLSRLYLVI